MAMSKNKFVLAATAAVVTLGIATVASHNANAEGGKEKCYGVAKAGANDCGGQLSGHSCAGQAAANSDPTDFIVLPEGICERLSGGSMEPKAKEGSGANNG